MSIVMPEAPEPTPARPRSLWPWHGESAFLRKLAIVAGLALATLVPNLLISGLIEERQSRQDSVEQEFAHLWGPPQALYGPVLIIPYRSAGGSFRHHWTPAMNARVCIGVGNDHRSVG